MTTPVLTVPPDLPVRDAARLLLEHRIAAMPVVDGEGRLVGIVSEVDLLRGQVPPDPRAHVLPPLERDDEPPHRVADVMTRDVVALPDAADDAQFAALMLSTGVRSIPVVRGEHVVGIVARRDLLRSLVRDDGQIAAEVVARFREYGRDLDGWRVEVDSGVVVLDADGARDDAETALLLARTVPGVVRVEIASPEPA